MAGEAVAVAEVGSMAAEGSVGAADFAAVVAVIPTGEAVTIPTRP